MLSHFYNRFTLTSTVKSMNRAKSETISFFNYKREEHLYAKTKDSHRRKELNQQKTHRAS